MPRRSIPGSWAGESRVPVTPVWLESFVAASDCDETLAAIPTAAETGRIGDGKKVVAASLRVVRTQYTDTDTI